MTKSEEILKEAATNHFESLKFPKVWGETDARAIAVRNPYIIQAMHTYAAGFAEWKDRHYAKDEVEYQNTGMLQYYNIQNEDSHPDRPTIYYTTAQLMEIYDGEK